MKTINFRSCSLLLALSLVFTSCIDIVEELTINRDQSGALSYRIETSGPGNFLSGLTSLFENSVEDQIIKEAEKLVRELRKQEGITHIQYNLGGKSGAYYLQFDFTNYKSFNNALYAISGSKKTLFTPGYIKIGKSRFKKINFTPWLNRYLQSEEIEIQSPFITDNLTFKSIVHVPGDISRIRSADNHVKQSDRKTVQQFRLTEILDVGVNTGIKIRY